MPSPTLPVEKTLDNTFALFGEGYQFIGNRCRRFGADSFETRLMLQNVLCVSGRDGAELFYGRDLFTRSNALPPTTLRLLQDKGSVQSLNNSAHRHRKAMFVSLLMETPPTAIVARFEHHWRLALAEWVNQDEIELFGAVNLLLTRAACDWLGAPREEIDDAALCRSLVGMVENAGRLGPRMWAALGRREQTEQVVEGWIKRVRSGELPLPADAPLRIVAEHRDLSGRFLPTRHATVEVINLLRPIVAVGRWILFSALALHEHPQWRNKLASTDALLEPFSEEVRRLYPFFPLVGGRSKRPFEWRGKQFGKGQWVLLDLYGTNRDPGRYSEPESFRPERAPSWAEQSFDFVPQGGGNTRIDHRCPGERMTVALMVSALRQLTRHMDYQVPSQDLSLPLNRLPTRPAHGLKLRKIVAL